MKNIEDPKFRGTLGILLTLLIAIFYSFSESDPIKISIHVTEKFTNETVPYASVQITGDSINSFLTDSSGNLIFDAKPGNYLIHVSDVGYNPVDLTIAASDQKKDFKIELSKGSELKAVEVVEYHVPLIDAGNPATSKTISEESITAVSAGSINVKGSRQKKEFRSKLQVDDLENKLTAGEINDFSKWKLWENVSSKTLESISDNFGIKASHRYCFQLTDERGWPVTDAEVHLLKNGNELSAARSDNTGKAECWTNSDSLTQDSNLSLKVIAGDKTFILESPHPFEKGINHFRINSECSQSDTLDLAFIVDATGSMDDEIDYLKAEMLGLIQNIKLKNKNLVVRIASVFYRDKYDRYVVQYSDFNTNADSAHNFIAEKNADGGGDKPEGMDSALATAGLLSWSMNARARIAILIADAPPHNTDSNKIVIRRAMDIAINKGIRFVPIACSGIDESTEYLMRNIALLTNGTYLYLTDHSGVGDSHMNPTTDKLDHKKLNNLLLAIVKRFTQIPACPESEKNASEELDNNKLGSSSKEIEEDVRESIADSSKKIDEKVKIRPNPTSGIVTVSSNDKILEIQLFDINGKALHRFMIGNDKPVLDLTMFPVGQYILKVIKEKSNSYVKVIVQR